MSPPRNPFPYGRLVFFATGNVHKFDEARRLLAKYDIAIGMLKTKKIEIQDDIENVAMTSATKVAKETHLPIIVEDAGLFIQGLKGFPGPYSSYVFKTIGNEGILNLLENTIDREAVFKSAIAFCNSEGDPKVFRGETKGWIFDKNRGTSGFGFDPIFEPSECPGRTFGEMTLDEKNQYSHRMKSLRKFAEWYKSNFASWQSF